MREKLVLSTTVQEFIRVQDLTYILNALFHVYLKMLFSHHQILKNHIIYVLCLDALYFK